MFSTGHLHRGAGLLYRVQSYQGGCGVVPSAEDMDNGDQQAPQTGTQQAGATR